MLRVTSVSKISLMGLSCSTTVLRLLIKIFNVQIIVQFYQLQHDYAAPQV